jgi:hypothetical protein
MAQMIVNLGAKAIMNAELNNVRPAGGTTLYLGLYTNAHTPASTDTMTQITEATGGGYARLPLTNGSWTLAFTGSIWTATYATQTFVCTGPLTTNTSAIGYFIVDADGVLRTEEAFATPFIPFNNGDSKAVVPTTQGSHGTPAA